ncbi:hypothetical protein BCR33DRAFT_390347 [Rhizoclosmatium globosum]|uniref:Uncharacterized protein n=1 Tax=Rhizoclosmatium globosum TaxID=329046 RepID=A0A1Y2BY08_9FUNG|nr:hypothetical protein BCR33DRAFT_390347 [Rhizoclosmatium globosum]|eukprot:ORY39537.1 hypothetical protein BCR33DRAFT_390347 [Rhizoclosmatium globosum]
MLGSPILELNSKNVIASTSHLICIMPPYSRLSLEVFCRIAYFSPASSLLPLAHAFSFYSFSSKLCATGKSLPNNPSINQLFPVFHFPCSDEDLDIQGPLHLSNEAKKCLRKWLSLLSMCGGSVSFTVWGLDYLVDSVKPMIEGLELAAYVQLVHSHQDTDTDEIWALGELSSWNIEIRVLTVDAGFSEVFALQNIRARKLLLLDRIPDGLFDVVNTVLLPPLWTGLVELQSEYMSDEVVKAINTCSHWSRLFLTLIRFKTSRCNFQWFPRMNCCQRIPDIGEPHLYLKEYCNA